MENTQKSVADFDMARVNEYLHLERIPSFTMTREQRMYLQEYREALMRERGNASISGATMAQAFRGMGRTNASEETQEDAIVKELENRREEMNAERSNIAQATEMAEGDFENLAKEAQEEKEDTKDTKTKTTKKKSTKKKADTTESE